MDTQVMYPVAATAVAALSVRFDAAVLRYDGWFLVFVAVLLALGATLLAGMAVWCVVSQNGRFSGRWQWNSGILVEVECV